MNTDLSNISLGEFVIAKSSETNSSLYVKTSNSIELVTDFSDAVVPNMLVIEDGILSLTIDGDPIGEGVTLPTGVTGLGSEQNLADGTVDIWLIDDDGNQLGEKITVSASGSGGGGGGGSLYTYNIRNALSSTKFNATTAESSIKIKFRCEEKDSEGLIQGTASTVVIEYSSDKTTWAILENIQAQNGQDIEREYAIETLKTGVNYIRVSGTAGTAENASGEKMKKSLTYEVSLIDCRVVTKFDPYSTYTSNITVQYSCVGSGLDKTAIINVTKDNSSYFENAYKYGLSSSAEGSARSFTIDTANFEHGVYTLDLYYTYVDASGVERQSAHQIYDLMFSRGENYPLIGAYLSKNKVKYGDEVKLTYVAYTAGATAQTQLVTRSIYYFVDGEKVYLQQFSDANIPNNAAQEKIINTGEVGFPTSGTLYIEVAAQNGASKTFELVVEELEGVTDVTLHDTLKIAYIAPRGQMNAEINKDSLDTIYVDRENTETNIKVEMNNFNFTSNGFLQDSDNVNIVRMSGDARLKIHLPLFENNYYDLENKYIKLQPIADSGRTAEFRFKVSNVTNANTSVINFLNVTEQSDLRLVGSGFRVEPKSAYIINSAMPIDYDLDHNVRYPQNVAVTHFCDNEIIRLSFVVEPHKDTNKQSLRIYTNGELTRIIPYNKTNTISGLPYIELGSNDCVLDLYSAVFYEKALSESEILTNYLADIPSIPQRIEEYNLNKVQNDDGVRTNANYFWIDSEGNKKDLSKNFDSMLLYTECTKRVPCVLTTGPMSSVKGDKTKVGAIYTKPGRDGEVITVFSSKKNCQTNVQGTTSSKLYPRYNYKLTSKNEDGDKVRLYLVRNNDGAIELMNAEEAQTYNTAAGEWVGESTLCWKADVMSPDHANTVNASWFTNFFNELTPPQEENKNIHPTVWGCRCLLFNRLTEDGEISFMGDGCLNNDKGNPDTFGLSFDGDEDASDPYWYGTVHNVTHTYINDKGELEELDVVENEWGDIESKCQKWEFLDNGPAICNFKSDRFFEKVVDSEGKSSDAVLEALESTFPDQGDLEDFSLTPNYNHIQLPYLWLLKRANFWENAEEKKLDTISMSAHYYKYKNDNGEQVKNLYEYRRAIFKEEFTKHFNLDHTAAYFIAVTITALIDNYAKNLFLSCYNTQADRIDFTDIAKAAGVDNLHAMMEYAKQNNGDIPEDFINWETSDFAVWYPTLYDLDSCYGVDNKGYKWVPYYADWDYLKWGGMQNEDDKGNLIDAAPIMNGNQSYFWRMFYNVFYDYIAQKYRTLATNNILTIGKWKDEMITKNIDTVPVAITTEDAIFKYAMPWWYGYTKDQYTDYSETDAFLYLIQANKKLQDTDFMVQRFNMYDSEFEADAYVNDYIKVLLPVGASGDVDLTITPVQDMYCGVQESTQGSIKKASEKTKANESQTLVVRKNSEDTVTVYGASLLREVAGLDQLQGTTYTLDKAINLRKLKLGGGNVTTISLANCKMLEQLDVSGCTGLGSIDLTNNSLLKEVIAKTNSSDWNPTVTLPNGGYIEKLNLPPLQNLTVRNQTNLKEFKMGTYQNDTYVPNNDKITKIYIESNMPAIPLADIMIDSLDTIMSAPDGGLRLTDVYLDISAWDYDKTRDFVDLLTSDRLKGTQLDVNGNYVSVDDTNPETWYPIISGVLKVNNDIVDDELDTLLTRIILKYPNLYIKQPDEIKSFGDCKWFEIAAICAASKNGTLYNITEDNLCSLKDVWEVGENKITKMLDDKYLNIAIAGFDQALDVYGNILPLNLMTYDKYPDNTISYDTVAKYNFNVKIDDTLLVLDEKNGLATYTYLGDT